MADAGLAVAPVRRGSVGVGAPQVALGVVVLVWAIGPLLNRGMHTGGAVAGFYRMWLAVPVSFAVARWRRTPVTWSTLRSSALAGLFFVGSYVTSYESLHRTTVANSSLIMAMQSVAVMLVAYPLFGERFGRVEIGWSVAALGAMAAFLLAGHGGGRADLGGDLLAVASLAFSTAYFVEMKRHRRQVPVAAYLSGVFLVGALCATPYAIATGAPVGAIDRHDLTILVAMVLLPGMLGHGLMTWVQRHVAIGLAVMLTLASTVLTAVGAWALFDQPLAPAQVAAGAAVLACLAALLRYRNRSNPVGPPQAAVLG